MSHSREAQVWVDFARADLAMAKAPLPDGARYEQLCFSAQQAAEKAIKAVLVSRGVAFPFVHDLRRLAALLPDDLSGRDALDGVETLTPFAVTSRYPFSFRDSAVDKTEYDEAIRIANEVVSWATGVIATPRQQAAQEL